MENVFLKPVVIDGKPALVRDPVTKLPLKREGEWKALSTFWQRRLRDNDVVEGAPEAEAAPAVADPAPEPEAEAPAHRPHRHKARDV
jgi:hypothetical protein